MCSPTLFCLKRTGPRDSILMAHMMHKNIGINKIQAISAMIKPKGRLIDVYFNCFPPLLFRLDFLPESQHHLRYQEVHFLTESESLYVDSHDLRYP